MQAIDVMTSEVISVDEDATVPAVARLLAERGISGPGRRQEQPSNRHGQRG